MGQKMTVASSRIKFVMLVLHGFVSIVFLRYSPIFGLNLG